VTLEFKSAGAPLYQAAPHVVLACLLVLCAASLRADGPDAEAAEHLPRARSALARGGDDALRLAATALKAAPAASGENLHMSLTMFWAGHFEDSARYMRRAIVADRNALAAEKPLAEQMPAGDARLRLNELATQVEDDPELCFLTGTLLLLNKDRTRALAFLIRAEELAGTDAQAARLADSNAEDRNRLRGEVALAEGDWDEAARSFTFAALDEPTVAEHYAGLALALAGSGDDGGALTFAGMVYARYRAGVLLPWLQGLKVAAGLSRAAARLSALDEPGLAEFKLAALLYFAAGHYAGARDAGVRGLMADKLDDFLHDLHAHMDKQDLRDDPQGAAGPADPPPAIAEPEPEPEPAPAEPSLDDARRMIRRGDYTGALKALDALVTEAAEPPVYHLVFVAAVGRGELNDALAALLLWFQKAEEEDKGRLNSLRELFSTAKLFDDWRAQITRVRDADPNRGLPRLLNCYVEVTRGRYGSARDELVVAKIESPGNALVIELDRILSREDYRNDRTPDGVFDDPSPRALMAQAGRLFQEGDYEGAKAGYLRAMEGDPALPYLTVSLLRCYFALGDYDNAVRQLRQLFNEQEMADKEPRDFVLLLDAGYTSADEFEKHLKALKQECDDRPLSTTPWLLYGVIQLTRTNADPASARDALKVWHDNDRSRERDPILVKLYEYARKRAS
jgi:tetratricopeptide (TPR) repeat protein